MRKALTLPAHHAPRPRPAAAPCLRGAAAAPDEFAVARNAPLVIPPDYSLTPPVAGTAGLSAGDAQQQAIDALFGGPAPRSASETSLLEVAGARQRRARHPLDRPATPTRGSSTRARRPRRSCRAARPTAQVASAQTGQ